MVLEVLSHEIMHIITGLLAGIVFVISSITYARTTKTNFLYLCGAFLVFAIKEILLAMSTIGIIGDPTSLIYHFLNLVILSLFAIGILR